MNGPEREKQEEEQWQVDPLHGDVLLIFYWKLREDIMQVVESDNRMSICRSERGQKYCCKSEDIEENKASDTGGHGGLYLVFSRCQRY
jgi:hypothetical protein